MHRGPGLGGGGAYRLRTPGTGGGGGGVLDGKIAGLYDLEETLGRGHFAVVKLARHVFTGEKVAVKVIDKSKLDEVSKAHLFQEVRCMKLVQHPNVVRLYEVIDTATKLYLILELGDGGDLYDYIMRHESGLTEELARAYFRQIVRAISYCHRLHVVHRDLKPENVVFFERLGVVKLTDFGFSNRFCPGQKLETSCGSLAYSAPEILLGDSYDAPAVDVWSLGVILYMLVCGQAPFQEANDSETLTMIMDCKYTVPAHITPECKNLIAKMLVRDPEKRATLAQIAAHPWLAQSKDDQAGDALPLVSREQLTEDDHNLIVQKIVNGNIATKEEIQESLDKDAYNHITATYFLLAERKLKSRRTEVPAKGKRPEHLAVPAGSTLAPMRDVGTTTSATPCLLTVPRTPGDIPQRSRKCSIVQEDEEEEDLAHSGREELGNAHSLNRRGSRSEGRLNIAVQERLVDVERRKPPMPTVALVPTATTNDAQHVKAPRPPMGKSASIPDANTQPIQIKIIPDDVHEVATSILTESSTVSIPLVGTAAATPFPSPTPKYKTMPSPARSSPSLTATTTTPLQLNEIFEEGEGGERGHAHAPPPSARFPSRTQKRTSYEQRRSKFHKTRTASCSSSDASDDDSEGRKKRAHKLGTSDKPLRGRRDSHDDSSDSQEPGTGGGATGGSHATTTTLNLHASSNGETPTNNSSTNNNNNNTQESNKEGEGGTRANSGDGGESRRQHLGACAMLGRRHKASRRRGGETRLRESQSLNRITEVQEDGGQHCVSGVTVGAQAQQQQQQPLVGAKAKGLGARLLQGLSMGRRDEKVAVHVSRKDAFDERDGGQQLVEKGEKEGDRVVHRGTMKKMRLLGKYFQVHKRLCIPLPGLFARTKLYKAQSCGSLARDRIEPRAGEKRATSGVRNSVADINQNGANKLVHHLDLTGLCASHFPHASKCCSFC